MKIWIARDDAKGLDEFEERYIIKHPESANAYTKLHLFYDKPEYINGLWQSGRIASEIPNYMFSEIYQGECWEFETEWDKVPDHMHYSGRLVTKETYKNGL